MGVQLAPYLGCLLGWFIALAFTTEKSQLLMVKAISLLVNSPSLWFHLCCHFIANPCFTTVVSKFSIFHGSTILNYSFWIFPRRPAWWRPCPPASWRNPQTAAPSTPWWWPSSRRVLESAWPSSTRPSKQGPLLRPTAWHQWTRPRRTWKCPSWSNRTEEKWRNGADLRVWDDMGCFFWVTLKTFELKTMQPWRVLE